MPLTRSSTLGRSLVSASTPPPTCSTRSSERSLERGLDPCGAGWSRFATSGVRYGLFCSTPGVAVARNVGRKHAMEMLLTGRFVDAAMAERWGLINRAVPAAQLDNEGMALVNELAQLSPYALRIGKEGFYRQVEATQADAYLMMGEAISCNAVAPDGQEGIAAFVEKRTPVWQDSRVRAPLQPKRRGLRR